mmetsp:Transcript_156069/g.291222  ORF Transcript_156069/g.291222 Transcript_156069/m.291222 type:complete len:419 (-) Transcript_156069:56-1312(-)
MTSEITIKNLDAWKKHEGTYIAAGGDLAVETMTLAEAKAKAMKMPGCKGFTHYRADVSGPMLIYFKSKFETAKGDWTSYELLRPIEEPVAEKKHGGSWLAGAAAAAGHALRGAVAAATEESAATGDLDGEYTLQQKSNMRFLDAYEDDANNYAVVTRAAQGDDSQKWLLKATGDGTYTIQQKVNMRFLDAYQEVDNNNYAVVTRPAQGDDSQKWVIKACDGPPSKKPRLTKGGTPGKLIITFKPGCKDAAVMDEIKKLTSVTGTQLLGGVGVGTIDVSDLATAELSIKNVSGVATVERDQEVSVAPVSAGASGVDSFTRDEPAPVEGGKPGRLILTFKEGVSPEEVMHKVKALPMVTGSELLSIGIANVDVSDLASGECALKEIPGLASIEADAEVTIAGDPGPAPATTGFGVGASWP